MQGPQHLVGVLQKAGLTGNRGPPGHDDLVERDHGLTGSMDRAGARGHRRDGIVTIAAAKERPGPSAVAHQAGPAPGHFLLGRADLPPPAKAKTAGKRTSIEYSVIGGDHKSLASLDVVAVLVTLPELARCGAGDTAVLDPGF